MRRFALSFVASCLALSPAIVAAAGDIKDIPTLMTVRGKQILADDFSSPTIDPRWKAAKGTWDTKAGVLHGVEVPADKHAASIRTNLDHKDAAYQFDFRFDQGKTIHLSINGAKGHICRVTITPGGFLVKKDGSKTDAADKPVLLDSCKMTFEQGKTYTMLVKVLGDEILARVDDKHFGMGSDPKVASAKTNFGFPIAGEGAIDNLHVWEAKANPDWATTKAKLAAEPREKLPAPRPAKKPATAAKAK